MKKTRGESKALDDDNHIQLKTFLLWMVAFYLCLVQVTFKGNQRQQMGVVVTTQLFFICALSKRPKGQIKVANRSSHFVFNELKTPEFYFFKGQSLRPEESQRLWMMIITFNWAHFYFGWLLFICLLSKWPLRVTKGCKWVSWLPNCFLFVAYPRDLKDK